MLFKVLAVYLIVGFIVVWVDGVRPLPPMMWRLMRAPHRTLEPVPIHRAVWLVCRGLVAQTLYLCRLDTLGMIAIWPLIFFVEG